MAAEQSLLLRFISNETLHEGVHNVCSIGLKIEVQHLRIYNTLFGLNLLDRADKFEISQVWIPFLLLRGFGLLVEGGFEGISNVC